ncbi:MAG: serine hydrolase [Pseudomonadota bacterium]
MHPSPRFSRLPQLSLVVAIVTCLASPGAHAITPTTARQAIEGAQSGEHAEGLGAHAIEDLLEELGVPGASVAVIWNGELHWAKGYGVADVETGRRVDTHTLFQAASISKPVAAMASLEAVQDGKFGLHQDVNEILTSWQLDGEGKTQQRAVTPAALMSHTSGLGDAFGFPGYAPGEALPTTIQILEGGDPSNVPRIFMEREPGVAYEYSGGGVTLQQLVLSDARKMPFAQLMRERVLTPLGMADSTFEQPLPPAWAQKAAHAHSSKGAPKDAPWHVYPELAAAGLWTTPSDLAAFAIDVQRSVAGASNRVLDSDHARRMITPVGVGPFAVGFSIEQDGQGWYFSHGGANWGFRARVVAHVSKGYGLAVMTNSDNGGELIEEIAKRVQRTYAWDVLAEPVPRGYRAIEREEVSVPREILTRYVGVYMGESPITVTLGESGLLGRVAGGSGDSPLFASSPTEFFLKVAPITMEFLSEGDEVVGMRLVVPSGEAYTLMREANAAADSE